MHCMPVTAVASVCLCVFVVFIYSFSESELFNSYPIIMAYKEVTLLVDNIANETARMPLMIQLERDRTAQFAVYYTGATNTTKMVPHSVCLHLLQLGPGANPLSPVKIYYQIKIADLITGQELEFTGEKFQKFQLKKDINKIFHGLNRNTISHKRLSIKIKVKIKGTKSRTRTTQKSWKQYGKLLQDLSSLLFTGEHSDLTVVSEDGGKFVAHSVILIARSKIFATMLTNGWSSESTEKQIKLPFPSKVCDEMLKFLYSCQVPSVDSAAKLVELAHMYEIEDLKQTCEPILIQNLKTDSVVDILLLADQLEFLELKSKCMKFIFENGKSVLQTSAWKMLSTTKPELKNELLERILAKNV